MHRLLGAEFAAQHFVGAIGDHLVEVHVGLGAGPGLPDHQRKVPVELAVDHLARGADDGAGAAPVEQPEFAIGLGGSKLDHAERMNDRHRHPLITDAEISPRPFGLGTPVAIGGNVDRAEAVGLGTGGTGSRGRGHPFCRRKPRISCAVQRTARPSARHHFLRKRSSRTTSAPSFGFLAGSAAFSAGRGAGAAAAGQISRGAFRRGARRSRTAGRIAPRGRRSS